MTLNSRHRWITVFWTVCALLFAQGALAGYACPADAVRSDASVPSPAAMPCAESMVQEVDEAQPALCHAHCQDEQQSADSFQPPLLAPSSQLGAVLTLAPVPDRGSGPLPPLPQWRRDTAPRLAIRHCCFRT